MSIDSHPCAQRGRRRSGFTIIELLTVVAILTVLVALLIPVSGKIRSRAKAVECMNRLRQSGAALLMYAADHKNTIRYKAGGSGGAENLWTYLAASYVLPSWQSAKVNRAFDVYYCPDYHPFRQDLQNSNWQWDTFGGYFVPSVYSKKEPMLDGDKEWTGYTLSLANLPLSTYPMLMDSVGAERKSQRMNIISHTASAGGVSVHMRHSGMAHVVFYDGHVRAVDQAGLKEIGFKSAYDRDLKLLTF